MDVLKGYILLERLGSGSFGVVWKALRRVDGQLVAIKMIDLEESEEDIMELQREVAFLQSCDHRFVTQYHESFVAEAQLCIVMELMAGGSVLDLAGMPELEETHIALICKQSLASLEYLHAQGRIHRDVKAANILVDGRGHCKLADFGVAAQVSSQRSQRHTFVGTPFWMAPEVIEQVGYDTRADIWSLGITAIELALGQPPLTHLHPMRAIFHIPKNPPPHLPEGHSNGFKDFVAQCLRKDPRDRPFARDLMKHRFLGLACAESELWRLVTLARSKKPTELMPSMNTILAGEAKTDWQFGTVQAQSSSSGSCPPSGTAISATSVILDHGEAGEANGTLSNSTLRPRQSSWEHSWPAQPERATCTLSTALDRTKSESTLRPSHPRRTLLDRFLLQTDEDVSPGSGGLRRFFEASEALQQSDERLFVQALEFLTTSACASVVQASTRNYDVRDSGSDESVTPGISPISQLLYSRWFQEIQRRWQS